MQLFLSWSGERSKALAAAIRDWIPLMLQPVAPWFSPEDIDKGSRWLAELSQQLDKQGLAIVCVTAENMFSPWLLFEAGALSKAIDSSSVCPLLLGVEPTDVQGPLTQFQATRASFEDVKRLVETINRRQPTPLPQAQFDTLFTILWPRLERTIAEIPPASMGPQDIRRTVPDILGEVLERVRALERQLVARESQHALTSLEPERETGAFAVAEIGKRQMSLDRRLDALRTKLQELASAAKVLLDTVPGTGDPKLVAARLTAEHLLQEAEDEAKKIRDLILRVVPRDGASKPTPNSEA